MDINIKTFHVTGAEHSWYAEAYDVDSNIVARVTGCNEADVKTRIEDYLTQVFTLTVVSDYTITI